MDSDNLVLVVGAYADAGAGAGDDKAQGSVRYAGDDEAAGAVVLSRDTQRQGLRGRARQRADVAGGAVLGGTAGLVVGLVRAAAARRRPWSEPGSVPWVGKPRRSTRRSSSASRWRSTCRWGIVVVVVIVDDTQRGQGPGLLRQTRTS